MDRSPEGSIRRVLDGIGAVLLDMDGTLVDVPHDWTAIRRELGVGPGSILDQLDALPEPERTRKFARLDAIETAACREARPAPGARAFLDLLRRENVPAALVTNNSRRSARTLLERLGWRFPVLVTRDDGAWKPSPEPFLIAARALGVPVGRCLAIGDAWLDREAARAAGCAALWLVGREARRRGNEADLAAPDLAGILERLGVAAETLEWSGA